MKINSLNIFIFCILAFCSCKKDKFKDYPKSIFEEDSEANPFTIDSLTTFQYAGHPNALVYYHIDTMYFEELKDYYLSFYKNNNQVLNIVLGNNPSSYVSILQSLNSGTYYYKFCIKDDDGNRSRFSNEKVLIIP